MSKKQDTLLLPLFPLRLVLFPGQVLPLHIFEPRYRLMINQCIDEQRPFGVVLMRQDTPDWRDYQQNTPLPYDVGTTAHIRRVEQMPDGRFNILAVGVRRFRVRKLNFDMPYLQGDVEAFPLEDEGEQLAGRRADDVRRLLREYMQLIAEISGAEFDLDSIPDDTPSLAFLTAIVLQIPWDEKQDLLAQPEASSLLQTEHAMLRREKMLLQHLQASQEQVQSQVFGSSGYLYPN